MSDNGVQRIATIRREYNRWVADETMEDYALRYTPKSFRKWSEGRIANTALSAVSFLALEAIGGTLALSYGFTNTLWAVLCVSLVIVLTGLPISYYAARYGVDMDLLTRGAGFGYLGSTLTSLIYASFTFLFFALEAAILSLALELYFQIPLALAYVISSLVIIPLVAYGVTLINRIQLWTQPLWLLLLFLPYLMVIWKEPQLLTEWTAFAGSEGQADGFNLLSFGAACTVALALVTQIGEQVDYLRFLPEKTAANRTRWWAAVLFAGPGWILPGALKILAGAFLAFLAVKLLVPAEQAAEPTQMYLVAFGYVFESPEWALAAMVLFVIVSQVKINLTNAYAGSLAWSNFFARVTHSHPGRVVWLVFNVSIALVLMELGVLKAIEQVLGLYANVAIAWIGTLVADLVINKPLGLSPQHIEFKRAHLYDINPVGMGSMVVSSLLAILAYLECFGPLAASLAPMIALLSAFILCPLIARLTRGRYYLARNSSTELIYPPGAASTLSCAVCDNAFEREDMAHCPMYAAPICSLCCSLDARCEDACKPHARLTAQLDTLMRALLPSATVPRLHTRLARYLALLMLILGVLLCALTVIFSQVSLVLPASDRSALYGLFFNAFLILSLFAGLLAWWLVLSHESRSVAQEESNRQTALLMQEIEAHKQTDLALQRAKEASEAANAAKSRYVTGLSHELRSPLNSILGYAQILQHDPNLSERHHDGLATIYRSGAHLLSLIDGLLDIARIEAGKLNLELSEIRFPEFIQQIQLMFTPLAEESGLAFHLDCHGQLPAVVRGDEKRIRQILINLLGNAVRYTRSGSVTLRVNYMRETATFDVCDTGAGIPADQLERLYQPFERGDSHRQDHGLGLGLTITRMLTALMGGELSVTSTPGLGTTFQVRLFLSEVRMPKAQPFAEHGIIGYQETRRRVLVVDDQPDHRRLMSEILAPLGFEVQLAESGEQALAQVANTQPDLVLMDLSMPGLDGWQTLQLLRSQGRCEAPVIVVSANAFADDRERSVAASFTDFLPKPVQVPLLLEKIQQHLHLTWIKRPPVAPTSTSDRIPPSPSALARLRELNALGHMRGLLELLDQLDQEEPASQAFTAQLRSLAKAFQLNELKRCLDEVDP